MTITDIDKQFSEKFEKCDGYMCGHETTDDHYVIWDEDIKQFLHQIYTQAKAEQREETAKEIIEMIEKDESDYDFGEDYSIAKYNMVKLIKSKYGIGD